MSRETISVLVVDDSQLSREIICDIIAGDDELSVAGVASDGDQVLSKVQEHSPQIVTMDVHMPKMDGLHALENLLAAHPLPVIMVSSATSRGAETTLRALDLGAMDYIEKPASDINDRFAAELTRKLKVMARADVKRVLECRRRKTRPRNFTPAPPQKTESASSNSRSADALKSHCFAIGISTGGPPALTGLLSVLNPPVPPIAIVQHMPELFTNAFAKRLNDQSSLTICEALDGMPLAPNTVLIAPGGKHMFMSGRAGNVVARIRDGEPVAGHRPSVDVMMASAAEIYGANCLGVIMTGMGRDGVDGCQAVQTHGGYVLGQDEFTSDVYGMNKAAFVEGHVDKQFPLQDLPLLLRRHASRMESMQNWQPICV